ncbi:nitrilase-related carbon-nitrogen hydrolase [Gelria sp. Kuro-4]|uniref:nitrilase-related carbon-nitrogen hydrolase n=1 Tax=Gelria sp. Kuro-4 TaxID=2796927 RepID=UPI001BEF692D|nr:nitrilase-related carbon-nitrogen hydrolase [Gelria sp. Kuro-4]BCV24119.1 carbon-nitrogen hydrolase [Gelria sp. Kuro-4]
MPRNITIAAIQMASQLANKAANWAKAKELLAVAARQGAQIACLPELFLQGYHLSREEFVALAETQDQVVQRVQPVARELGLYIVAPYAEQSKIPGIIYNSALLCSPEGHAVGNMRKVYLWGEEKLKFRSGSTFPVFDTPLGRLAILICYDAEFSEPPRIVALQGAELVFIPSVWSVRASNRWSVELAAAALYNQYFVVGVNTIGEGICGASKVVNPRGETVIEALRESEQVICATIDLEDVAAYRSEVPYFSDLKVDTFRRLVSLGKTHERRQ